ncbi:MAG: phosphonate C-P lyase system protein PhnG [Desulfovibrio sp.]|uniref:phosphonate C-P lyase system protein PhnG n=1 Tax=Desulfovibrio sp. TaxID=885 RepID=UPI002A368353|nr:phosphonate C-P lyase system protein PhnG [Desulfovibrio sp.]MDY0259453.1 phosphonate C-P lyase system protein PhnG [Desulfovibrio sp.]
MTLSKNAVALTRPQWMRLLALAPEDTLQELLHPLAQAVSYTFLRRPEAGLLMVEGKTGGARFNLGEMLITRCAVTLSPAPGQQDGAAPSASAGRYALPDSPVQGYAWICGNRPRHAELAALCDALMQLPGYATRLSLELFDHLRAREAHEAAEEERATAPTRVDFFTLARGEDA